MAAVTGLSEKGFKIKKLADIKSDMENELRNKVDQNLNFDASTVAGSITAIVANQAAQVWESLAALYHALQANTATGFSLDALCSLTGTYRKKAEFSKAEAEVLLQANTKLPAGHAVKTTGGHIFKLEKEVANNSADDDIIKASFVAQEPGSIMAHAQTKAEIMNKESGWLETVFTKTTHVGRLDETDQELRARRILELKANGVSTIDAIKSRLMEIPNVDGVYIKEGKQSFSAYIKGGDEEAIAQTIWRCRPVGVTTVGDIAIPIELPFVFMKKEEKPSDTKDENLPANKDERPTVSFSRPKSIGLSLMTEVRIKSKLQKDSSEQDKKDEVANVKNNLSNALADYANKHLKMGAEVYNARFYATILNHPQVLDVTKLEIKCKIGSALPPEIQPEQIASLELNDISVLCSVVG